MAGHEGGLVGEDGEAGLQAGHGVDAVRVVEEAVVGDDVGLGLVPLREHAPVGLDERVDVGLLQALGATGAAVEEAGGSGGGEEGDDAEEAHFFF